MNSVIYKLFDFILLILLTILVPIAGSLLLAGILINIIIYKIKSKRKEIK
nr:MAG TPA: Proline-rich membrane anchor 1 [Bacteriophage sp.]